MAFKKQRMGRKKVCYFTKNKIEKMRGALLHGSDLTWKGL